MVTRMGKTVFMVTRVTWVVGCHGNQGDCHGNRGGLSNCNQGVVMVARATSCQGLVSRQDSGVLS